MFAFQGVQPALFWFTEGFRGYIDGSRADSYPGIYFEYFDRTWAQRKAMRSLARSKSLDQTCLSAIQFFFQRYT